MKKCIYCLFLLLLSVGVFVSCKDDNESIHHATHIEGTYKGTLQVKQGETVIEKLTQKVYVAAQENNEVAVKIKHLNVNNLAIGNIEYTNVPVAKYGSVYSFTVSDTLTKVENIQKLAIKMYGEYRDGGLNLSITLSSKIPEKLDYTAEFIGGKMTVDTESDAAELISLSFPDQKEIIEVEKTDSIIWIHIADTLSAEQLETMSFVPAIAVSPNATVTPANGTAVKLNSAFKLTVTAEDGVNKKAYHVGIMRHAVYTFADEWVLATDEMTPESGFFTPANRWWDTSNTGIFFIKMMMPGADIPYVVTRADEGMHLAASAKIQTADTKGMAMGAPFPNIPKVTSGSLFNGKFETDIFNTLNSTKFGTPFTHGHPIALRVTYKYTPGEMFHRCADAANAHITVEEPNTSDEYSLVAVLYEVENEKDVLTGVDLNTSDKVVFRAEKFGIAKDWSTETLPFILKKEYDSRKNYKLAIVFSSSRWGDTFSGAPGSTLLVERIDMISYDVKDNTIIE